jgi:hypothetical protein
MLKKNKGQALITILIFGSIATVVIGGLVGWIFFSYRASISSQHKEMAFHIAESGIDYYRWHLAHAPTDYQDGTREPGPYIHDYKDKDGNIIGQFSLTITPPSSGSTITVIRSTGYTVDDPELKRTIETRMAIPSLAKYAVVANADMRFGAGTEVFGEIRSNGGIRFDGLTHNIISSARIDYDDPDHGGGNEFGVHTHIAPVDPLPPTAMPSRPDVFEAGRELGVPPIDFNGLSADLAQIKTNAQAGGFYRADSGAQGYHIILRADDTFDLYRINSLRSTPSGCGNPTWSIRSGSGYETLLGNFPFPANNLIFIEDDLWINGQINGARLTIASAKFPESPTTNTSITVNNDLLYTNTDGSDVIALIAQKDINIGLYSEDDLRIDGALVAKTGRVGRFYYNNSCGSNYIRNVITLNGMIATNQRYGFAYTDGTGYQIRNLNYDGNLLYAPPPSFPLSTDQYETISWREMK